MTRSGCRRYGFPALSTWPACPSAAMTIARSSVLISSLVDPAHVTGCDVLHQMWIEREDFGCGDSLDLIDFFLRLDRNVIPVLPRFPAAPVDLFIEVVNVELPA